VWSSSTVTTDAPKWVITHPGGISPESLKRLAEQADEAMESGSVIVLPEGMMLHRVGDTNYLTPEVESTISMTDEPRWLIALTIVLTLLAACCAVAAIALAYIAITWRH
jgi:hypothetical protein